MGVIFAVILAPILIALPILAALERGISRGKLFFVVPLSFIPFPFWVIAVFIATLSKSNPEIASSNFNVCAKKIVRFFAVLATILIILFIFLGNPFRDRSRHSGSIAYERTIYIPVK